MAAADKSKVQTSLLKYLSLFPFHGLYLLHIYLMDGKQEDRYEQAEVEEVRENGVFHTLQAANTLFS